MAETGQVIDVENDKVVVKLKRTEACAKCRACTAGMASKDMIIRAYNYCGASIGDSVEIVLEESDFITAVVISYGIPFVFFLAGTFLGYFVSSYFNMGHNELVGFGLGIVSICVSYFWIKSREDYWKSKNFVPKAIRKV